MSFLSLFVITHRISDNTSNLATAKTCREENKTSASHQPTWLECAIDSHHLSFKPKSIIGKGTKRNGLHLQWNSCRTCRIRVECNIRLRFTVPVSPNLDLLLEFKKSDT